MVLKKRIGLLLLIIILCSGFVSAKYVFDDYDFLSKFDVLNASLVTGGNATFDYLFGNGGFLSGIADTWWPLDSDYLYNGSGSLSFNESKLNSSIDLRQTDTQVVSDGVYLYNDSTTMYFNETRLNATIILVSPETNPAGSDTYVQFNDGGSFGADSDFTWTSNNLDINGKLDLNDDGDNLVIGEGAGRNLKNGSYNNLIGYQAGYGLTNGDKNVLIGFDVGSDLTTESNRLFIDNSDTATPLIYGEFDNDIVTINGRLNATGDICINSSTCLSDAVSSASGNNQTIQYNLDDSFGSTATFLWDVVQGFLGIGTATPSAVLDVQATNKADTTFIANNSGVGIWANASCIVIGNISQGLAEC